jgi:hypothetical protein
MRADVRGAAVSATLVVVLTTALLIWFGRPADAQDCKSLPPGPEKKQCLMQQNPDAFQKKQQRCKDLAEQHGGSLQVRGTGQKGFMQGCLQGKTGQ